MSAAVKGLSAGEASCERNPPSDNRVAATASELLVNSSSSNSCSISVARHARRRHACFLMPRPPYLGLSRQFLQSPQSPRMQPAHEPHRAVRVVAGLGRLLPPSRSSSTSIEMTGFVCAPESSASCMQHCTAPQKSRISVADIPDGEFTGGISLSDRAFAAEELAAAAPKLDAPTGVEFRHFRLRHDCLRMPWPPNFGLSRQLRQFPQSSRQHASHRPQDMARFRFFCAHHSPLVCALADSAQLARFESPSALMSMSNDALVLLPPAFTG
mmetsp:Transcript_30538/g.65613  ORF Transcript_30538/g.65613 Transcript_30538/m.65613 type:complete len:270 (-) Transcript_30538:76-885(-)